MHGEKDGGKRSQMGRYRQSTHYLATAFVSGLAMAVVVIVVAIERAATPGKTFYAGECVQMIPLAPRSAARFKVELSTEKDFLLRPVPSSLYRSDVGFRIPNESAGFFIRIDCPGASTKK